MNTYTVTLTDQEYQTIQNTLDQSIINKFKLRKKSSKTIKATQKANNTKIKIVKNKMKEAVTELKRLNKPITAYSISKISNIAPQTARKYFNELNLKKYYVASWSGGKDSTYMIDELLRKNEPLDEVIFCDTGYEFPQMYDYIEKVELYWKKKYPKLKITKLNWGKGKEIWHKWSDSEFTKGEHQGSVRGFPFQLGMSWCTRELKVIPLQNYYRDYLGEYDLFYEYIGIAYDEPKRVKANGELYPLVEWKITEREVAEELVKRELHNPLYNHFARTGCYLCPKQSIKALYRLYKHYPNLWVTIEDLQLKYKNMGSTQWLFQNQTTNDLIKKFKEFDKSGEPTNYLDQEEIGCFCK